MQTAADFCLKNFDCLHFCRFLQIMYFFYLKNYFLQISIKKGEATQKSAELYKNRQGHIKKSQNPIFCHLTCSKIGTNWHKSARLFLMCKIMLKSAQIGTNK